MKITRGLLFALLACGLTGPVNAQRNEEGPVVLERGANYNLVRSEVETDEELMEGMEAEERREYLERLEGAGYTELASGLNYLNGGEWTPSVAVFENFEEGIVARQGQTKVILNHSLNHPLGSVDLLASDGGRMRSSVFGIAYFDRLTGQSVMIAQRKESRAVLVPPNYVVYLDAFEGDVSADLRYTYRIGGFEQDVILRENPPSPLEYGLNPESTVLEVWTEFAEAPVPQEELRVFKETEADVRDLYVEPDMIDSRLDFGAVRMVRGKAFALTDVQGEPREERSREVPTAKRWQDMGEDGIFLIEAVDYLDVAGDLSVLPEAQANVEREPAQGRAEMMAAVQQESPRRIASVNVPAWGETLTAVVGPSETLMASAADFTRRPGYVLDYITESGSDSNYTFIGDETYYISAPYTLTGTTVFEGGAVIKYDTNDYITIDGSVDFQTDMYRPVTFTSKKDGTIGHYVTTNGADQGDYSWALKFDDAGTYTIKHARFRYATRAMEALAIGTAFNIWHAQVVDCGVVAKVQDGATINLYNVLVVTTDDAETNNVIEGTEDDQEFYAWHLTADKMDELAIDWVGNKSVKNSLLTEIGTSPSLTVSTGTYTSTGSSAGIYQSAGAGSFYLAEGSTHRNAGTASITDTLDADLEKRTTYPPVVLGESAALTLSTDTTWSPVVQRDNDGSLDRGYHYPPIDYAIEDVYVANGTTLTVQPGTAVAQYGIYGLLPRDGSTVLFEGTVENPINLLRYESAQENPQRWDGGSTSGNSTYYVIIPSGAAATAKTLEFRFTDFNLADDAFQYSLYTSSGNTYDVDDFQISNCRFFNGYHRIMGDTGSVHDVWNNQFSRGYFYSYYRANLALSHNFFKGGTLYLNQPSGGSSWTARDNVFDDITLAANTWSGTHTVDYNGYANGETSYLKGSLQANDATDATITYASGVFGDYYQPSSGNSFLNGDDSRTPGDVGLYHYTVLNDTSKDTGDLDLGFHYVAVNSEGEPVDTDGDGIPDYLEDEDGDGNDDDTFDWDTSENGTSSGGGQLQIFTMLE